MKISIITVCYNSAATIAQTIESVAAQHYSNVEHVIVDGGSTDATKEIVEAHASVARFISEPDRGIYDAMNKGLALATGDVVGFLNADDYYADDSVLAQVAETFADSAIDACYADLVYVRGDDPETVVRCWRSQDYRSGLCERGWMPAHPTFFVRRGIYEQYGGFDLAFPRQADFELTMRLLAVQGIRTRYIPKIWVKMRMGGVSNNSILGVIKGNLEAYRACRKNGFRVWMPWFIVRKVLSRVPQFFRKPPAVV